MGKAFSCHILDSFHTDHFISLTLPSRGSLQLHTVAKYKRSPLTSDQFLVKGKAFYKKRLPDILFHNRWYLIYFCLRFYKLRPVSFDLLVLKFTEAETGMLSLQEIFYDITFQRKDQNQQCQTKLYWRPLGFGWGHNFFVRVLESNNWAWPKLENLFWFLHINLTRASSCNLQLEFVLSCLACPTWRPESNTRSLCYI